MLEVGPLRLRGNLNMSPKKKALKPGVKTLEENHGDFGSSNFVDRKMTGYPWNSMDIPFSEWRNHG